MFGSSKSPSSLPSEVITGFTNAIFDYQNEADYRTTLQAQFASSEEDVTRFLFSYQNLAYSVALVIFGLKTDQDKTKHMAFCAYLDTIVEAVYKGQDSVVPERIIQRMDELEFLHQIYQGGGGRQVVGHFMAQPHDFSGLFSGCYAFRAIQIFKSMMKTSPINQREQALGLAFASCGAEFAKNITMVPDHHLQKLGAAHFAKTWFRFMDVKF